MIKKYISRLLALIMLVSGMVVYPADNKRVMAADYPASDYKAVEAGGLNDGIIGAATDSLSDGTYDGTDYAADDSLNDGTDSGTYAGLNDGTDSGYVGLEIIEIDELTDEDDSDVYTEDADFLVEEDFVVYSAAAESYISTKDFSVYCNDYLRNYLTDDEKAFYDALDEACYNYLTTTADAKPKNYTADGVSKTGYLIKEDGFDCSVIGMDRASELISLFIFQNPQYYFVSFKTLKSTSAKKYYILSYEAFVNGADRAEATMEMFEKVDGWVDDIQGCDTDYDKEKRAENIICANTIYLADSEEYGGAPYEEFEEQGWTGFDQSAYSMVMLGKTVCAGYAKSFEMLMNACGILTIGITSDSHAWNKVRLNGIWYNVDGTWDDGGSGIRTTSSGYYLNKTDAFFAATGHHAESYFSDIAPVCDTEFDEALYYASVDPYVAVTGISLIPSSDVVFRLYDGTEDVSEVSIAVSPEDATNKDYHIYVEDESVAYYEDGKIYGISAGETTFTVKSVDTDNGVPFTAAKKITVYDKYATPAAPVVESKTATSVTLSKVEGCEYSLDGKNWRPFTSFTGLNSGTDYTFYMRKAASTYYIASESSEGTTVRTNEVTNDNSGSDTSTGDSQDNGTGSGSDNNNNGTGDGSNSDSNSNNNNSNNNNSSNNSSNNNNNSNSNDNKDNNNNSDNSVDSTPTNSATVTASGIYVLSTSPKVVAGCVTQKSDASVSLEYRWLAYSESDNSWAEVSPWTKDNEWLVWQPEDYGDYVLLCYVRVVGNEKASQTSEVTGVSAHPYIKGKCQMPYWGEGGGYLIGVESYDNPSQEYSYEMLILDCTLLAQNLPAWTYTTGRQTVSSGNAMWTIWQPEYGYYWTLFRVYDKNGTLIDEECYGFANVY